MLGRLEMDIDQCILAYSDLAESVFGQKKASLPFNICGNVKATTHNPYRPALGIHKFYLKNSKLVERAHSTLGARAMQEKGRSLPAFR